MKGGMVGRGVMIVRIRALTVVGLGDTLILGNLSSWL